MDNEVTYVYIAFSFHEYRSKGDETYRDEIEPNQLKVTELKYDLSLTCRSSKVGVNDERTEPNWSLEDYPLQDVKLN